MKLFSALLVFFLMLPVFGQENFFTLKDGTKLYLEEKGQGKTILFIPGWTMTHRFFDKQKDYFSKNYRVVVYDPRGQGRADKTPTKNTYAHHASDLRELILEKDLNEIILVGWSSGCLTMYEYLRAFGTNGISKMVFIDEPPKWIGNKETEWVYGTFEDYRSSLKSMVSKPNAPDGIIDWMLNDPIDHQTRTWMREEMLMTPPDVALSLYIDGLVCDYNEELKKLQIPSLFMARESWYHYVKDWLKIHAPKAQVHSVTSHAMFWEQPDVFNEKLEKFIQSK